MEVLEDLPKDALEPTLHCSARGCCNEEKALVPVSNREAMRADRSVRLGAMLLIECAVMA